MTHDDDWYQLHQLLGGNLHEHWRARGGTIEEIVTDAAGHMDEAVLAEFDRLREMQLDDEAMSEFLQRCGCALRPEAFGKTPTQFVAWIEELVRAELAKTTDP